MQIKATMVAVFTDKNDSTPTSSFVFDGPPAERFAAVREFMTNLLEDDDLIVEHVRDSQNATAALAEEVIVRRADGDEVDSAYLVYNPTVRMMR